MTLPAPISDDWLRCRLETVRRELLPLEGVSGDHAAALSEILWTLEQTLLDLGWDWPEPPTDADRALLDRFQ